jgi:hypothetical protein
MAQRALIRSLPRGLLRPCAFCIQHPRLACLLLICVILLLNALSAFAQTSQSVVASVPVTATGATTTTSQVVSFTKSLAAFLSLVGAPVPRHQCDIFAGESSAHRLDHDCRRRSRVSSVRSAHRHRLGRGLAGQYSRGYHYPIHIVLYRNPSGRHQHGSKHRRGKLGHCGLAYLFGQNGRSNAGDFAVSNGCTATNGYATNTACTLGLTFTPAATGPRAATLTITDDALNSPQTVAVSGNANALLTVAPAVGSSFSASIAAGQVATFNLQLTAGFDVLRLPSLLVLL